MDLTRRLFLALPPALAIAEPTAGEVSALSCFLPEELPMGCLAMYDKTVKKPAWVLLDSEADKPDRFHDPDSPPLVRLESGHFITTFIRTDHFIAVPVEASEHTLEKAARSMLAMAASQGGLTIDPEQWFEDRDLPFDRLIEIGNLDIAVTEPDYLGRHAIYREGVSGLAIHNPNAAVIVMTDKTKETIARAMVRPVRCGGWDYKVKA